jgi:hypothetical protein
MRTALVLSVSVGVVVAGLLVGLLRRRSSRQTTDVVSGQWIAEQRSKSDQTWP